MTNETSLGDNIFSKEEEHVIYTYEKVLSGNMKAFSPYFFDVRYRRSRIITLTKYLIEKKLGWTPEESLDKLTYNILKEYKLSGILKFLTHVKPVEYENDNSYVKHVVYFAYSQIRSVPFDERVISCYKEVLANKRKTFPKNYFRDKYGEERAKICFDYLWKDVLKIKFEEIPKTFLKDNETGLKLLRQYKLKILVQIIYFSVSDMIINMYPEIDLSNVSRE